MMDGAVLQPTRRQMLVALPWGAGLVAVGASAAERELPVAASLADALREALAKKQPLVVMASLVGCPYCKIVRENYLLGELAAGQPVVQIDMRSQRVLAGFDGRATTHTAWLQAGQVDAAPTVLFFGPGGREVAERLRGLSSPDFYGAYLQQRLDQARAALRS